MDDEVERGLDQDHHVARHCTKNDFVDGEVMEELAPRRFEPTQDDPDISVNWLEFYKGDFDTQLDAVCRDMATERDVRRRHKLGILELATIRNVGDEFDCELNCIHDKQPDNDSHTLITGIPLDAPLIHQELADLASENLVNVIPYKKHS